MTKASSAPFDSSSAAPPSARKSAFWLWLHHWATIGAVDGSDPADRLKVVMVNVMAMIALFSNVVFNALFFVSGVRGLILSGLVQWPFALLTCVTFWLHSQGSYHLARAFIFTVILLELCIIVIAGQGTVLSAHYYLLLIAVLSLPLYRLSEWRWCVFFMVLSSGIFLFLEFKSWPAHPSVVALNPALVYFFRTLVIGSCVATAMGIVLMTEIASENYVQRLQSLAMSDVLTGLPNRRAGTEQLIYEAAQSRRTDTPLVVAMVDIDHFKRINDEEGHDIGDLALRHVARLLHKGLRNADFIARMGGEEFAVLMPSTTLAQAHGALDALRVIIASTPFQWAMTNGKTRGNRELTVSIGVATIAPGLSEEALLHHADLAMYQAKALGRNRVVSYDVVAPPG